MMQTGTLTFWRSAASNAAGKARLLVGREVLLVVVAGLASAVISQLGGRVLHAAWPIVASGSLVTALPRAIVLMALLVRVNRFGVLTAAGVVEVAAKATMGGIGFMPWALVVPILGNLAGDLAWTGLGSSRSQHLRASLAGGCLCTARVLAALLFWAVLLPAMQRGLAPVHWLIIGANMVLGATGGVIVSRATSGKKREKKNDPSE